MAKYMDIQTIKQISVRVLPLLVIFVILTSNCVQQPLKDYCVHVYDGDSFELNNGEVVRLIGIDAPELSDPGGEAAREYLIQLIRGKQVLLYAGPEEKDNYGRLLRYVYVEGMCINEEMIRNGYAVMRYLSPGDPKLVWYTALEIEAESARAGLWGTGIFQPRSDLEWGEGVPVIGWMDANRYYGQYVIVEGTIVNTYNSGNACFLNFDPNWQQCFTAVIFACDFPGFPDTPEVYYLGKKVQVIGVVREYKGSPEIIVKTFDQIRVLS